jgi:hypothetical protein
MDGATEGRGEDGSMKLGIESSRYGYRIGCLEDGEFGVFLGDDVADPLIQSAEAAVASTLDEEGCFVWPSRARAQVALRLATRAVDLMERPMPVWARQALAAGWKAPQGWQP